MVCPNGMDNRSTIFWAIVPNDAKYRLGKHQKLKAVVSIKQRCDERFTHAFTACGCVFKEITLVGSNQGNYFENATA